MAALVVFRCGSSVVDPAQPHEGGLEANQTSKRSTKESIICEKHRLGKDTIQSWFGDDHRIQFAALDRLLYGTRLTLKTRYGDEFAVVEAPGVTIGLHPAKDGGPKPGSLSVGLGVDDVEISKKQLEDRGVAFTGEIAEDPLIPLCDSV